MRPIVYSYHVEDYTRCTDFFALRMSKEILQIPEACDIVIKINMCDLKTAETGAVTHPLFLRAFILHLKALYPQKKIYVAEADATVVFAADFFSWLGYAHALMGLDAVFINFATAPSVDVPVNGYIFSAMPMPLALHNTYFITLAKLKTNVTSLITCALKNQYALIPGLIKSGYHSRVDEAIADANLLRRPDFSIVDGIIGQGGAKAPAFGTPISARCVVFGKDPVAVDTYCSKLMGIPPVLVRHLALCEQKGIGETKYFTVGDIPRAHMDFETSTLELLFFRYAGTIQRAIQARMRT